MIGITEGKPGFELLPLEKVALQTGAGTHGGTDN